jgi:hypothetical protein
VVALVAEAKPYPYQLPVAKAALVMIDFQRDFMEPGGFGAALGNDVGLLQVGGWFFLFLSRFARVRQHTPPGYLLCPEVGGVPVGGR